MITAGVAGRFKLEAVDTVTGARRELTPWFNNLITDQGLNQLGVGQLGYFCMVGTGTATPAVTDTTLGNKIAHTTTTVSATAGGSASAPYYGSYTVVYRFAAGVATGNLTEVGIGYSSTLVFSRTLIKDGSGNPTTITVLSTEALDVTYEFRLYSPSADVPHSTVIAGVTYTGVVRASSVTAFSGNAAWYAGFPFGATAGSLTGGSSPVAQVYSGTIGAVTGSPTGTNSQINDPVDSAYSANSMQRTGTVTAPLSTGNVGGIQAVRIATRLGAYQISFSPAIPKDATKVLTLGLTLSWARMVI